MLTAVTGNLQNLSGSTHEKYFSHSWQGPCGSAWEFISYHAVTHVPSVIHMWRYGYPGIILLAEGKREEG